MTFNEFLTQADDKLCTAQKHADNTKDRKMWGYWGAQRTLLNNLGSYVMSGEATHEATSFNPYVEKTHSVSKIMGDAFDGKNVSFMDRIDSTSEAYQLWIDNRNSILQSIPENWR